jgi:heme-degrading monooxygenase HmoA
MSNNSMPYTVGLWTVKAGKEKSFIAEWEAFARWTSKNQPGAETGYLLQDPKSPEKFISFGPWENEEAINGWRESREFKDFASKARELCSEFQPRSLVLVATSEANGR